MSELSAGIGRVAGVVGAGASLAGARVRAKGAVVLSYHDVVEHRASGSQYDLSPGQFRRQLLTARQMGFRFVDLAALTTAWLAGASVDGLAAVVFDDGLVGVHRHALPVLAELSVPATVFTVTDGLGSRPPWWPGAARMMTPGELCEMAGAGVRIASHTRRHPSLPGLEATALRNELAGARRLLEDLVQTPVALVAYPFGHHDAQVREAAADAGYVAGFSFLNGRITAGLDRYRLPRLNMWRGQGRARLAYHLARPASSWPDTQAEAVCVGERGADL